MKVYKLLIVFLVAVFQSCTAQTEKINGVSFVASGTSINNTHVAPVVTINANYAAVMPFGFIRSLEHPEIVFNTKDQWFGETRAGARQYIETLKKDQINIMLKPQIWVWRGAFTGDIRMTNEADWNTLETTYTKFILEYAALAQEVKVGIFCIGTELQNFIEARPAYWNALILEIKAIYKGKLTYAANWDEFKSTPFWNLLDYIGVDAYFPVSDEKTPTIDQCMAGWKTHKPIIKELVETHNKPILFTEFGYRSVDFTGKEPWKSDRSSTPVNLEAQTNSTKALFNAFWTEAWFAGGFIWKWYHNHEGSGGKHNTRFTPQNKPVEAVIREQFSLH